MSEGKQKLLKKLKGIVRRRKPARKWRRLERKPSKTFSFTSDKYEALEEIQQMLGFTDEELATFSALLKKADDGYLAFQIGNIHVEFNIGNFVDKAPIEVNVRAGGNGEVTYAATYQYSHGLGNLAEWEKRL